jgi:hypothetical protein
MHADTPGNAFKQPVVAELQLLLLNARVAGPLGCKVTKHLSIGVGECLPLNSLKTLDPATARALAGWEGNLFLDGLTELDAETATALAEFRGERLSLDGLTKLDAVVAQAFARDGRTMLFLNGLTTLDADTAKALKGFKELSLDGLTTLDADTATALAANGEALSLNGLKTLDADTAEALAAIKGSLFLNGLTTLDADTAKVLAEFSGSWLWLDGLTTLDADTAGAIAECKATFIGLQGLTKLEAGAAERLAGFRAENILLREKVKKKFQPLRLKLFPEPLTPENPLTQQTALTFKTHAFARLTALESPDSVEIAKALASRTGPLLLPNLKKISPKTLTALLQKADVEIPPIESLELIPEPDGSPTDEFVIPGDFTGGRSRRRLVSGPDDP